MAQDTIDKIINIQFNYAELVEGWKKATLGIEENKRNLKELTAEYKRGEMTQDEYLKAQLEIKNTQKALADEQRKYTKEIQNNIKIETAAAGSLEQLRANVSKLTSEYNKLSAKAREGDFGKRLAADIKSQQEAISEAEMSLGNYRSQVGNYENAIKNALGANNQFANAVLDLKGTAQAAGGALKTLFSPFGAAVGAIGAVTAAFKLFKASIHSTQMTGDAYDNAMAGWVNTWDLFKRSVSAVDFSLFIRNAAEAAAAGRNLQAVLDELFERTNSINIQEAELKKRNAELLVSLRNQTLSIEERKAAGEEYLKNEENIAKQREELAKATRDAELENLFALTKAREYASEEEREAAKQEFANGIRDYNLNREKLQALNEYNKAQERRNGLAQAMLYAGIGHRQLSEDMRDARVQEQIAYEKFVALAGDNADEIIRFQEQYLLTNDKLVDSYVKAEVAYQNAGAAYMTTTQRAQTMINSLTNQQNKQNKKIVEGAKQTGSKYLEEYKRAAAAAEEELLSMIQSARDKSMQSELQTLDEGNRAAVAKVDERLAEIEKLQKTAAGEEVNYLLQEQETLNRIKIELEEKYWRDVDSITRKYSREALNQQIADQEKVYKNRLLQARLSGGMEGAEAEAKAIAEEELKIAKEKYDALVNMSDDIRARLYDSEIDYQNARLNAELAYQNAVRKTGDIASQKIQQRIQAEEQSIQQLAGALSQASSAMAQMGEESEAAAVMAKILAIASAAASMGLALKKAFESSATVWDAIAGAGAAITFIGTVISSIKSLSTTAAAASSAGGSSTKVGKYAKGGLVTGPGGPTSDSVPIMASAGEGVMTAAAVTEWGDVLSAINVASGGNPIQVSNLPEHGDGMQGMQQMFERALSKAPQQVLVVEDMKRGERRVQVRDNLIRRKTGKK